MSKLAKLILTTLIASLGLILWGLPGWIRLISTPITAVSPRAYDYIEGKFGENPLTYIRNEFFSK